MIEKKGPELYFVTPPQPRLVPSPPCPTTPTLTTPLHHVLPTGTLHANFLPTWMAAAGAVDLPRLAEEASGALWREVVSQVRMSQAVCHSGGLRISLLMDRLNINDMTTILRPSYVSACESRLCATAGRHGA